jgi:hypothetical protein
MVSCTYLYGLNDVVMTCKCVEYACCGKQHACPEANTMEQQGSRGPLVPQDRFTRPSCKPAALAHLYTILYCSTFPIITRTAQMAFVHVRMSVYLSRLPRCAALTASCACYIIFLLPSVRGGRGAQDASPQTCSQAAHTWCRGGARCQELPAVG